MSEMSAMPRPVPVEQDMKYTYRLHLSTGDAIVVRGDEYLRADIRTAANLGGWLETVDGDVVNPAHVVRMELLSKPEPVMTVELTHGAGASVEQLAAKGIVEHKRG
ncbi:hypothetical protein ACFQH9_02075 [Pseudonocardia lutea]|uniref:Uncharacterized protein n=1 Tax=Pseudonocardia lutea TaxID=2172015 RepID=A0ABW1I2V0_9PSEU